MNRRGRSGRHPRCRSRRSPGTPRARGTPPSARRVRAAISGRDRPPPAMRVIAAGAIALTLMPCLAPAVARLRVSPMTPPFAAAYERLFGRPNKPGRRRHDDAPVALLDHVRPRGPRRVERTVHVHRQVPGEVVGIGVGKTGPAHDARVVDQDVDPCRTAAIARATSAAGARLRHDVVAVGDAADLRRDLGRDGRHRTPSPSIDAAEVVHDDLAHRVRASSVA